MEHKAFAFDSDRFGEELRPTMEAALSTGDCAPLVDFIRDNRGVLTDPDFPRSSQTATNSRHLLDLARGSPSDIVADAVRMLERAARAGQGLDVTFEPPPSESPVGEAYDGVQIDRRAHVLASAEPGARRGLPVRHERLSIL